MTEKSRPFAYVLWGISGIFGGHRFYLRRFRTGAAFPCLIVLAIILGNQEMPAGAGFISMGILIWWVVDIFLIPGMVCSCNNASRRDSTLPSRQISQTIVDYIQKDRQKNLTELKNRLAGHNRAATEYYARQAPGSASPAGRHEWESAPRILSHDYNPKRKIRADRHRNQYEIEYADADGVITTRTIDVISVLGQSHAMYIQARCHMRHGERTFRVDRILSARDADSGEPIINMERHFYGLIPEEDRPDPDHDAVMSRVAPGLGLLVWIAKADREITTEEAAILLAFIDERNVMAGAKFAKTSWSKTKATIWIDRARPTFNTSSGVLGKISRTGREYALLKRYADQLADAGGEAAKKRARQLFRD